MNQRKYSDSLDQRKNFLWAEVAGFYVFEITFIASKMGGTLFDSTISYD